MKIEQAQKAKFDPRFVLRVTLIARINPSDNGAKMELRIIGSLGASKMELWFGLVWLWNVVMLSIRMLSG